MRQIRDSDDLVAALVDLYEAALQYTHSNQGEEIHRKAYMAIDDVAHGIAFWVKDPGPLLAALPKETYWKVEDA